MLAKNGGRKLFDKGADDSAYTLLAKNLAKIAVSCTVSEILRIFQFHCLEKS